MLSTQEAADLVGVSRPYIVARIEAGDIALHQQVGNQRRALKCEGQARREPRRRDLLVLIAVVPVVAGADTLFGGTTRGC